MTASDAPIVVAGAGIGGLAAALALARAGRRVLVLERAEKIEEVGAGLQIAPNAGRILEALGLAQALASVGVEPACFRIRRAGDGETLARLPLKDARERFGAPFRVYHRADLQGALLEEALRRGVEVRTNAACEGFAQAEGAITVLARRENGVEALEAEALIGADGLRSQVRTHLRIPGDGEPPPSGLVAWRALVAADAAPPSLRAPETQLWLGPKAHLVHYPLRDGSIINVVAVVEDRSSSGPPALAGEELARAIGFPRWSAELRALVEAAPSFRRWPLFTRPRLARWSVGRVTLLGDAAHPMVPFLAQGAAQAIEDALALAQSFAAQARVPAALEAYQAARIARATKVQRNSRRQGLYFHLPEPLATARDLAIRALGGRGMLARNAWLYR